MSGLSSPTGGGGSQSVAALLSSMKKEQTYDYLRAGAIPDLAKCLAAQSKKDSEPSVESIQFSDEVIKINRKQKKQSRVLLLTNRAVYNFEKGSYKSPKRRINIKDLCGCILSRCSDELVLQVEDSYDYRYEIHRRSDFLEMLSRAYDRVMAHAPALADRQLMVTFSEEAELKDMVITKDSLKNSQRVTAASLGPQQTTATTEEENSQNSASGKDWSGSTNGAERAASNSLSTSCCGPPSQTGVGGAGDDVPAGGVSGKHHPSGSLGAIPSPSNAAASSSAAAGTEHDPSSPAAAPSPHSRRMSASEGNGTLRTPKAAKPRLSFVTHGTALLGSQQQLAAKGGTNSQQQPGSHLTSGQFVPTATATAAGTLAPPTNYRAHKHNSVIVTRTSANGSYPNLLGGSTSSASASAAAASGGSASPVALPAPRITSVETSDAGHAFRDPSSRLEGWLTKKKGSGKKWDRKYFVLTNSQLQYYAPRIKGNLPIKSPVLVERPASEEIALGTMENQKSTTPLVMLRVLTAVGVAGKSHKDSLTLAFATEFDAARWTDAFHHRNIPAPDVGGVDQYVHCEGWVLKKESDSKWVRRYVVLTGDRVWFMELGLKGSIDFNQGVSAHNNNEIKPTEEVQGATFAGRAALTRFAYRWVVSDSVRIFHLAADSEEDMTHWIESIDCINREHGKAGGSLAAAAAGEEAAALAADSSSSAGALVLPDEFISAVEQPAPSGQVTFVFTDVQSSTNLWEKVPDAMDRALEQHDRLLRELLKKYSGYEVKTEGDAFMVTFFTALDAILWCLDVQCTLLEASWSDDFCSMKAACKEVVTDATGAAVTVFNGIRIRMGIHTGFPNCRRNPVTGRMDYFGPVVNRSARVSDTGHGGQIVCTQEVVDSLRSATGLADPRLWLDARLKPLVSDMGSHALKGIVEDVRIYQLMPSKLALRTLPPIRTSTNEKAEKERMAKLNAMTAAVAKDGGAAAAGAGVPSRSPTPSPPPSAAAAVAAASSSPAAAALVPDSDDAARARAESTVPMSLAILVTPPNAADTSASAAASAAPAPATASTVAGARVSVAPEIPPPPDLTGFED